MHELQIFLMFAVSITFKQSAHVFSSLPVDDEDEFV
jgi:hypothetical protein